MPIISVQSDPENLTLTATGDYPVPVDRLWRAWADPRQLERFWGPPQWPATFTRHDMRAGGRSEYYMTGPEGQTSRGYWEFERVDVGRGFVVRDGFCDDGSFNAEMPGPARMEVSFVATATGSRFVAVSTFESVASMEQLLAMGMLEGLQSALAQLDEVIADLRAYSAALPAALEVVDDTHAVVRRVVRGSMEQVWRAHHEPALMQRWLLGPDGWHMPVCQVATAVGERFRYEWENAADGQRFGFVGELLEHEPPRREVTTERMIGVDGEPNVNELILTPKPGGRTQIEVRITYPSKEVRDMVLGTGMVDGMETSYARLEREVLLAADEAAA
ncbi:MAG: SRPBCC domain-containing protein [Myxococcales bacterium]|nr:SRPBCC domain-containing protein [Myxococcales bacterium]